MIKPRTKRLTIIIAALSVILIAGGIFVGLYLTRDTVTKPAPYVKEVNDFTVVIVWDKVPFAAGYVLSYRYPDFGTEFTNIDTASTSAEIPRKRGKLQFAALSYDNRSDSDFCELITEQIEAYTLSIPQSITVEKIKDEKGINCVRISFEPVTYKTAEGTTPKVGYYQICWQPAGRVTFDEIILNFTVAPQYMFYLPEGDLYIKIRPVNYAVLENTTVNLPLNLYELYEIPPEFSEWKGNLKYD